MIGTENFWWNKDNHCDSPHLRGSIGGFLRDGNRAILNRNTNGEQAASSVTLLRVRWWTWVVSDSELVTENAYAGFRLLRCGTRIILLGGQLPGPFHRQQADSEGGWAGPGFMALQWLAGPVGPPTGPMRV